MEQDGKIMNASGIGQLTFSRREAARRLGISVVTLDRELARNRVPHLRIGRRVLFTERLLQRYIDQNTEDVIDRRRGMLG
jgi:excisionase family DNA binding protein